MHYTGIGSRKTPAPVMAAIKQMALMLAKQGYTVRSGGAEGADTAFEQGAIERLVRSPKQLYDIYLPWAGFNGRPSNLNYHCSSTYDAEACDIAKAIHPDWSELSRGGKTLHTRNVYQVLGAKLNSPSDFLICWAPFNDKGIPKGGTRTAWVLARQHGIPCFNLNNRFDVLDLVEFFRVQFGLSLDLDI